MRHRKLGSKLGRSSAHRRAMFRNLVTSLLEHERVETTDAKAKQVRRLADRMITLGKRGTLHARRRALRVVRSKAVTAKVFEELADRYRERPGGYTRVVKSRVRVGDAAPLSIVELVEGTAVAPPPAPAKKRGRRKAADAPAEKPARRTRRKAADAEEAPARPRARRAKAAEGGESAPAKPRARRKKAAEGEEKPARSRSRRTQDGAGDAGKKKR